MTSASFAVGEEMQDPRLAVDRAQALALRVQALQRMEAFHELKRGRPGPPDFS